jgi:molybdopterin/thiamine biosynthesis adenylyltransferase
MQATIEIKNFDPANEKYRGTAFDRSINIEGWKQDTIRNQVCLILGVGACGTGVAMGMARLGVKKLILLDKDVVDVTNLNR